MTDKEIINLWKSGLSKDILAKIYKRRYNQQIKVIRADPRNRNAGIFISNYESLAYVEKAIYRYLRERR